MSELFTPKTPHDPIADELTAPVNWDKSLTDEKVAVSVVVPAFNEELALEKT